MKKIIFAVLTAALLTAVSCGPILPADLINGGNKGDEDVIYSADWKYISIYLDGKNAPLGVNTNSVRDSERERASSRAMTADTARRGFEFFEVFFYYNGVIARSSWVVGSRATVMDVYRNDPGVDYSTTNLISIAHNISGGSGKAVSTVDPVGAPGGSAILFAGTRDRTLLAVGKLISVDKEEPITDPRDRSTLIRSGTTYVTFELSALTANTSADIEKSSFYTNALNKKNEDDPAGPDKTKVINVRLGEMYFPLYVLPPSKSVVKARYNLGLDGEWSDFEDSIIVTGRGEVDKRVARYPAGGDFYYFPRFSEDLTTVVTMMNNQASVEYPAFFDPEIKFDIDTSRTNSLYKPENGLFTFSFSIPVCALSVDAFRKAEMDDWFIRTAYSSYYYNIDNGVTDGKYTDKNIGGAILCAVDLQAMNYEIPVDRLGGK
jgi:hypothetical protein